MNRTQALGLVLNYASAVMDGDGKHELALELVRLMLKEQEVKDWLLDNPVTPFDRYREEIRINEAKGPFHNSDVSKRLRRLKSKMSLEELRKLGYTNDPIKHEEMKRQALEESKSENLIENQGKS